MAGIDGVWFAGYIQSLSVSVDEPVSSPSTSAPLQSASPCGAGALHSPTR